MKRTRKSPGPEWTLKAEAARKGFNVSEVHFDRHFRKIAPDAVKTVDGRVWVNIRAVWDVVVARAVKDASDSDPLLADGSDSPGLERYRLAKAKLAELDLAERDGVMVRTSFLRDVLLPAISAMRLAGHELGKRFGKDASAIYNESIDEYGAAVKRLAAQLDKNPRAKDRR